MSTTRRPRRSGAEGLVGFKPTTVFDISQTEGEPLPELEMAATGDADELVPALTDAAAALDVTVRIVDATAWEHGDARGVCKYRQQDCQSLVEAKARTNQADLATTLVHEYAHAILHAAVTDDTEWTKREVEAEAVAYVVGRFFGLDTNGSAFYLAVWHDDDSGAIQDRLGRINATAPEIIRMVAEG